MNLVFTQRWVEHNPKVFTAGCCQESGGGSDEAPTEPLNFFIVEEFSNHASFSWDPYPGATGYNVYRAVPGEEDDLDTYTLTHANVPLQVLTFNCHYVWVQAITPSGLTPTPVSPIYFCATLPAVNYFIEEVREFDALFSWDPYVGATGYNVYRAQEGFQWDIDNYTLTEENIPVSSLPFNCEYVIVRGITEYGLTSSYTPLIFCQT